jgi:Tfp pilus assembly PilM family ATPase
MPELVAGLPDFQAEWAAHLFPEGHAPTAASLQISQLAIMNSMFQHPAVQKSVGSSVALFIGSTNTTLVAFQNRVPVLYREYPLGSAHVQQEIASKMQLTPILVQQLLEEDAMDASPYFEPILKPLIRQVEIMNDYLSRRRNAPASNFFISGALLGPRYWNAIFSKMIGKELTYCRPFEGLPLAKDAVVMPEKLADVESLFACAAGAALALMETI